MKKYLLFDLDGTLTDPKEGICTCVQYALASFGIEEPDLDKLEPFIGPPLKDSFMNFYHMDETQAEAAIEKYRERFRDTGIFENKLYEGIPEMLRVLNAKGMYLAVASSKPTVFVRRILEHFKIEKYFRTVVGSELDGTRTDKAEVVSEALRQLFGDKPVDTSRVYMIGDRRFDVEGAHAFGLEAVGVTYGYGSMEELREAKADYIVRSVEELKRFLLRGTEEQRQPGTSQKIWQLALPFLMFVMVSRLAVNFALILLGSLIETIPFQEFWYVWDEEGKPYLTGNASVIVNALGSIAGAASIWGIAKKTLARAAEDRKLLHLRREPVKRYLLLGVATIGLALGLNVLLQLLGVVESSAAYQEVAQRQYSVWIPLGLFCYGVISPVGEELLFRGILYNCQRRYMKLSGAMVVSAALFAMYHGNSVQGIYAFLMGCFMVYAYEYFGDFRMSLAVHMLANLLVYSVSNVDALGPVLMNWPVGIACLLCGAGSLWLLNKEKRIF